MKALRRFLRNNRVPYQDDFLRRFRVTNMTQPIGPNSITITNHPIRGLKGQRASAGIRQGPADGLSATCINGNKKPKINIANASIWLSIGIKSLLKGPANRSRLIDNPLNQN